MRSLKRWLCCLTVVALGVAAFPEASTARPVSSAEALDVARNWLAANPRARARGWPAGSV